MRERSGIGTRGATEEREREMGVELGEWSWGSNRGERERSGIGTGEPRESEREKWDRN